MNKQEWFDCKDIYKLLQQFANERKKRLFSLACAKSVKHLLPDQICKDFLDKIELFIDGEISKKELESARFAIRTLGYSSDCYWAMTAIVAASSHSAHTGALATANAVYNALFLEAKETIEQHTILKDIYNPYLLDLKFSSLAMSLAEQVYNGDDSARGILSDCLEEEGYPDEIVMHLKSEVHYKGCWVVDQILGKS